MKSAACLLLLGAACLAAPSGTRAATVTVVVQDAAGRPAEGAVVFLESVDAKAAVRPARDVSIAQVQRQFDPLVTVVTVGTAVSFPNRDTVRHHVYSFSPIKPFELKLYSGTPASPVVFDRPGIAVLGCNIHDTMAAWVVVVETPYHGRSLAGGTATLSGVPDGSYRLRAWHPGMPVGAPASDRALVVTAPTTQATVQLAGWTR